MALFAVVFDGSKDEFIISLSDQTKIDHARRIASGEETSRVHVNGTVVKSPASYNPGYSYHLDPDTIDFFSLSMEVCDAAPDEIERNLSDVGGAFLPNAFWCPWASSIAREVT